MRRLLSFLALIPVLLSAQQQITIRGHQFELTKKTTPGEESNLDEILLYRIDSGGVKKYLLRHTLYTANFGGCGDTDEFELGDYKATDSSIVFYSYWATAGLSMVGSCGVRKQEYIVGRDGKVRPGERIMRLGVGSQSQESMALYEWENEIPGTCTGDCYEAEHQKLVKKYERLIEKNYAAKSVDGKKGRQLYDEVTAFLRKKIDARTKGWEEEWEGRSGSFCR